MNRKSGGLFLPVAGMAGIVLVAWFLVFKSSSSPPPSPSVAGGSASEQSSRSEPDRKVTPALRAPQNLPDNGMEAGWRILYRDNWEYKCPVLGHHVVDPEEACLLIAVPARLGPIVVRDASVEYEKPFTVKRDPSVPLVKFRDPVMSLPEYVGPRFYAERMLCAQYPGKWMPSHRPVVDPRGRLIRYDPEHVRIFCGGGR